MKIQIRHGLHIRLETNCIILEKISEHLQKKKTSEINILGKIVTQKTSKEDLTSKMLT